MTPQEYLVKETRGRSVIEVLIPQPGWEWVVPHNSPACALGVVLVEIFGRWPSVG